MLGPVVQRLHGMARLLLRGVSVARSRWKLVPFRRFLLTVFLFYLLLVRMDPGKSVIITENIVWH